MVDFAEYYHYLRYHPDARAEIERAVDVLTTNETYLFREEYQLRAFQQEVLPLLYERGVSSEAPLDLERGLFDGRGGLHAGHLDSRIRACSRAGMCG